jgi:hypothetical protein
MRRRERKVTRSRQKARARGEMAVLSSTKRMKIPEVPQVAAEISTAR